MDSLKEWLTQPEGIATRLRALRAQAGLSGKQLADANDWAQSKVSRIENGKQMPSDEDIDAWASACHADPDVVVELKRLRDEARVVRSTFRSRMSQGQESVQESYSDLVENSRLIRYFETTFIPGLLQVPDYARHVLTSMRSLHDVEVDDVEAAVAKRVQSQQMLYDPAKGFEFLIGESALRWLICPPAVMRSQLDRLQTVIGLERVRFGVVPMGVELATAPQNSFQMFVSDDDTVVAVESLVDELFYRDDDAAAYGRAFDRMWDEAVTGEPARQLIIAATQALGRADA